MYRNMHSHIVHNVYYANVCVVVLQGEVVQADSSIVPAAVSGLSTQDVGLDLLKKKTKKKTASISRTHYPHHPTRTMEYLPSPPSLFP